MTCIWATPFGLPKKGRDPRSTGYVSSAYWKFSGIGDHLSLDDTFSVDGLQARIASEHAMIGAENGQNSPANNGLLERLEDTTGNKIGLEKRS